MKTLLNGIFNPTFEVPFLHNLVLRAPPVAAKIRPRGGDVRLNLLSATGTALLLAGIVSGLWLKLSARRGSCEIFLGTLKRVRYLAAHDRGDARARLHDALTPGSTRRWASRSPRTGWLFPFFSPLLGWLGVALTGSDTSSNVLFGNLQLITAEQLGMNPILAAAVEQLAAASWAR